MNYLPKALIYVVITAACYSIAKRGRDMLNIQDETAKKSSRIETELNLATEIQKNMLPCTLPAFPGHLELELSRAKFEDLCKDLFDSTLEPVRKALKDDLKYVEAFSVQGYIGTVSGVNIYTKKDAKRGTICIATKEAVTKLAFNLRFIWAANLHN